MLFHRPPPQGATGAQQPTALDHAGARWWPGLGRGVCHRRAQGGIRAHQPGRGAREQVALAAGPGAAGDAQRDTVTSMVTVTLPVTVTPVGDRDLHRDPADFTVNRHRHPNLTVTDHTESSAGRHPHRRRGAGAPPASAAGGGAAALRARGEKSLYGGEWQTTNNRMELRAAIEGLSALRRECRVEVYTDSRYLRDGVQRWLAEWKRKNWKTAKRKPVKNRDLWERLDGLIGRHDITWHWVKAHAGHPGNERADALANRAIDELRS